MHKQGKRFCKISLAFSEMFLLISMSFAVSFILEENFVSGFHGGFSFGGATSIPSNTGSSFVAGEETGTGGGISGAIGDLFTGQLGAGVSTIGPYLGAILGGLAWAGVAFAAVQLIGGFLGLDKELTNALRFNHG